MTAKIRIEYVRLRRGGDDGGMSPEVIVLSGGSAQELTVGAVSVLSAAAPAFLDGRFSSGIYARIVGLSGSAIVEVGDNTTIADPAGGTLVAQGDTVFRPIEAGQFVAAIEAVATVDPENVTAPPPVALTATIASGANLSDAIRVDGKLVGIILPGTWTGAALSFRASMDGVAWFDVYDDGVERTIASANVVASRFLAQQLANWLGVKWLKVRSGIAAAPQAQGAARAITLVVAG